MHYIVTALMLMENKSLTLIMRPNQCTLSADGPLFTTGFAKKLHGPTKLWKRLATTVHIYHMKDSAVKNMVLHQWTVILHHETWTMP